MTLVPTTTAELTTLADQINEGHGRVVKAAGKTLQEAMKVGRWLLEAYELVPNGEWGRWMNDNCDFDVSNARIYQRIAHYEHELTGDESTITAALRSTQGLPAIRSTYQYQPNGYPTALKAKARAMLAEGQTPLLIAEQLGINSSATVRGWRRSDKELAVASRNQKRRNRAARKALREQEHREAVMTAASPPVAELYSRVRLALEVVDAAILETFDSRDSAQLLREARTALYKAEGRIVKALGVE